MIRRHGNDSVIRCIGASAALRLLFASLLAALIGTASSAKAAEESGPFFDVRYEARLVPSNRVIHMAIVLEAGARHLKSLRFAIDPERQLGFEGDGEVLASAEEVTWTPPADGGTLRYDFKIDHLRDERSYDARCAMVWAIFRGGDLVPPVRTRHTKGARSRARLQFVLPEGWSAAMPYTRLRGGAYRIESAERAFARPRGWIALGDLGVVRETVAGTQVAIAGPVRHGLRRLDILALLRWNLPELNRILGTSISRLLIVGAGDPMWRGGLSGPASLFLHAARPLITQDATSPVLHEILHVAISARASNEWDWIVEGLAEYYSIELLRRTGTVSEARIGQARERFSEGVPPTDSWSTHGGAAMVRGVLYMRGLDRAIRERTNERKSLDDVLRALAAAPAKLDLEHLRSAVQAGTGLAPDSVMPAPPEPADGPTAAAQE